MAVESSEPAYEYSRWEKAWKTPQALDWHIDHVHPTMKRHFHELTADHGDNQSRLRIFVPLCGKSVDMLWLAEQGHEVVGVELVQMGIETFFEENDLSFTTEDVEIDGEKKATFYRCAKEGTSISILQCNIFSATAEILGGKFHAVWDRGSFVAIDPADRVKYVHLLTALLRPGGRLLLESFRYDQSKINGPPFSVSEQRLQSLFELFSIQELGVKEFEELEESQPGRPRFCHRRYCHLFTLAL